MAILDDYLRVVGEVAGKFQYVEECLKVYLDLCFKIVRHGVQGQIHFSYGYEDVAKQPLGRLVTLFAKYNSNSELIKALKALPDARNYIAHRAYLAPAWQQDEPDILEKEIIKVRQISTDTDDVVKKLFSETKRVEDLCKQKEQPTEPRR